MNNRATPNVASLGEQNRLEVVGSCTRTGSRPVRSDFASLRILTQASSSIAVLGDHSSLPTRLHAAQRGQPEKLGQVHLLLAGLWQHAFHGVLDPVPASVSYFASSLGFRNV